MRYDFKQSGWKYKEHFWFAWRPVFIQVDGEAYGAIVWREWIVRWKTCSGGGPKDISMMHYRQLTSDENNGRAALQGIKLR